MLWLKVAKTKRPLKVDKTSSKKQCRTTNRESHLEKNSQTIFEDLEKCQGNSKQYFLNRSHLCFTKIIKKYHIMIWSIHVMSSMTWYLTPEQIQNWKPGNSPNVSYGMNSDLVKSLHQSASYRSFQPWWRQFVILSLQSFIARHVIMDLAMNLMHCV